MVAKLIHLIQKGNLRFKCTRYRELTYQQLHKFQQMYYTSPYFVFSAANTRKRNVLIETFTCIVGAIAQTDFAWRKTQIFRFLTVSGKYRSDFLLEKLYLYINIKPNKRNQALSWHFNLLHSGWRINLRRH